MTIYNTSDAGKSFDLVQIGTVTSNDIDLYLTANKTIDVWPGMTYLVILLTAFICFLVQMVCRMMGYQLKKSYPCT